MTNRMLSGAAALVLGAALTLSPAPLEAQEMDDDRSPEERVRAILSTTPLFDGHNDLPWAIRDWDESPMDVEAYPLEGGAPGHTDIPRLREGMVGAQFWSVYVPCASVEDGTAARTQLEEIDIARRIFRSHPGAFGEAYSASDVERVFGEGRIASLMGMEGGHAIENSLGALRAFYDAGARYMTLTHGCTLDWADSATDTARHGGLTEFGREVVREMNRLGMLADLSHVSPETMHDVLDVTEAPIIFSHSSARALTDHPRNVPDDVLRRLPENGGVVMVTFVTGFINEEVRRWWGLSDEERAAAGSAPRATLMDAVLHIEHIREVAGIDHVGIGGDYDGIEDTPVGLEDVSTYPALFEELAHRGWTDDELRKLAGENVLRVMREAERAARQASTMRPPSTATIEELDGDGGM